ncbi:MAG: hypothetical protein ACHQX4_03330 [Gemmatimonadales bacterium]
MRAIERVRRARAALLAAALGAAFSWALLAFAAAVLVTAFGDLVTPLPLGFRRAALAAATLAAALAGAAALWRSRHAISLPRVALLLEERNPALQFALATALEFPAAPQSSALEQVVDLVDPAGPPRAFIGRAFGVPLAALAVLVMALAALPGGALDRVVHAHAGDLLARPAGHARLGGRLATIVVRIEPPAYTGLPAQALDDPSSVSALVASRVIVLGRGAALPIETSPGGLLGERALPLSVAGDTWSVALTMPTQPAVLRLTDRGEARLIALDPRADAAPVVTLESPRTDTTYAQPSDRIALAAAASDDIGLVRAEFELMHTAGSGERFTTRRWTVGGVAAGLSHAASIHAELLLDTLHLSPGDVLHVRAVAWDANTVSGPDTGASDTRTIRIADPRERDTLSLDLAGPARLDTTALSERMLILRAETLELGRPRLAADTFAARSLALAGRQDDVMGRVQAVIDDLMDVESPGVVSTSEISLLVQAASEMGDAERELRPARVAQALPHMRRALGFLMKARDATPRYYIRGRLPKVVVDVDRVRLKGTDPVAAATRTKRAAEADVRRALLSRLDKAIDRLARDAPHAADSLQFIRVDALANARDAAEPLGRAIDALRGGHDALPALLQARRRLERATDAEPALPAWQGGR